MSMFPAPDWMRAPRLEIASCGRDSRSRHVFQLVFHDHGPCVVWTGYDYAAAILAAEVYDRRGIEIVDAVVCAVSREGWPQG